MGRARGTGRTNKRQLLGDTRLRALSYTPSGKRTARALCCGYVRAERTPRDRGVHEALWGVLTQRASPTFEFRPKCLAARNSLRPP